MTGDSRIRRWTGNDAWTQAIEAQGPAAVRSAGAPDLAAAATAAAKAELDKAVRRRRLAAGLEVVLGAAGLAGLVATAALGPTGLGPAAGGTALVVSALLAAVPLCGSLHRAMSTRPHEVDAIAPLEQARSAPTDALVGEAEAASAGLAGRAERRHGDLDGRRHRRHKVADDRVLVTTDAGATVTAQLIDVSVSGAAVSCDLPDVRVGDAIQIGSRAAKVVRTLERGFACAFVEPAPIPSQLAAA